MMIPNDVLEIIESYLSYEDIPDFRRTCKQFSQLSIKHHDIYHALTVRECFGNLFTLAQKLREKWKSKWSSMTVVKDFRISYGHLVYLTHDGRIFYVRNSETLRILNIQHLTELIHSLLTPFSFQGNIALLKEIILSRKKYIIGEPKELYLNFIRYTLSQFSNKFYVMAPQEYEFWTEALTQENYVKYCISIAQNEFDWIKLEPDYDSEMEINYPHNVFTTRYNFICSWFNTLSITDLL